MQKDRFVKLKKIVIEVIGIIAGTFLMAVGISLFLLPNQLSSGGVAGIATITYYLLNIPMGVMNIFINIPLFLISIYKIGKSFFIKSILGTLALSSFMDLLDGITPLTNDRFLACIYGGIIIGLGTAIVLKSNASTGGSDLISYLAKEYRPTISMSRAILIVDIIVVTLNMIFFKEIEIGLYSAIAIYLMGKMLDILFEGIYFTKLVLIISDHNEEISKQIGDKIQRGTTGLLGKGMYTGQEKLVLMCAATRRDIARIKMVVREIDPKSFIVVTNSREVVGLGFKHI